MALALILSAAGPVRPVHAGADPSPICGDVNGNLSVTSSDALLTLRKAVGQPTALQCTECPLLIGYGNTEPYAYTYNDDRFSPGYLVAIRVTFAQAVTVSRLGVDLPDGGSKVKMALYKDESGSPGALVVATAAVPVVKGQQEIAVPIKPVAAGNYWLAAVYDVHTGVRGQASPAWVAYHSQQPFDDPFPDPFEPESVNIEANDFNYWVKVLP